MRGFLPVHTAIREDEEHFSETRGIAAASVFPSDDPVLSFPPSSSSDVLRNAPVLLQTEATEMEGWLADIEVLGANCSEELQAELRQRSGKKEGRHTRDPLLAVAQSLMSEEWRRFVREEPWILDDVNETLEAVWKQEEFADQLLNSAFTEASIKRNIDEISLIARRHLLSRSVGEYAPLVHEIPDVLPRPSSRPGKVVYDHKRPNENGTKIRTT